MRVKSFNAKLRSLLFKKGPQRGLINPELTRALPLEEVEALFHFIVRSRGPVREDFLPQLVDWGWFHSMGYLYVSKSPTTGFTFYHTCEHQIL